MKDLKQILNQLKEDLQLNQVEIGPLSTPLTISFYEQWLAKNYQAEMMYLESHAETKKRPQLLNENLKSVISVAQAYFPAVHPNEMEIPARVAMYANNKDYHFWLKEKLQAIILKLKNQFPDDEFLAYVDSGPVLERNWGFENGLGWFGKNTCLIHPQHGSLFFIAEILTTLSSPVEFRPGPIPDFCGTCTRCLDICPTKALVEPRVLKSDLCISYLTIEAKSVPPLALRAKMADWFFGCDLCQTICPWNEKVFRQKKIEPVSSTDTSLLLLLGAEDEKKLISFFDFLLSSSNKKIARFFQGSALLRSGGNGLKRNALIVIANRKLAALRSQVENLEDNPKLGELATWCLQQLD